MLNRQNLLNYLKENINEYSTVYLDTNKADLRAVEENHFKNYAKTIDNISYLNDDSICIKYYDIEDTICHVVFSIKEDK